MSEPIIKEALERFKESDDATDFSRQAAHEDMTFSRLADQWPEAIRKAREEEGRPCLTINKLPAFIRQVVNDARQNKPAITVHPVDNGADEDTAGVINGLVRSIERRSNADVAYDTAIDQAASGGFGFFQIGIDYTHADSFDLEARIERIANPLMVHWDPSSTEFDASDWDYAFVSDFMSEEEFESAYPGKAKISWEGDTRDQAALWSQDEKIRVADYWLREPIKRKILLLSNGMTIREEEYIDQAKADLEMTGVVPTREREVDAFNVVRRKINGAEVLEEEKWPGSTIPICPVWGEEIVLDGRRHFRSMVRDAKDPQTMFNFWRSATTELVALAPRAPFLMEEGGIPKGHEATWQTANTRSHPYLMYSKGTNLPQRQPFAGVPAGALQEALNASDDMKSVMGIYDASLGARSNETSGRAIMARQREADVSNFHFIDNLNRAIRYAGRVLVEIIPAVYKDRQAIRILGEDNAEKVVQLGGQSDGPMYDLATGIYDVDVKSGPSYGTQREETREVLIEIIRAIPGAAPILGDVLMEHMDFVGADRVAKRLKMTLPPEVRKMEESEADIPPEAQAMIAAKDQELKQLQAQMQQGMQAMQGMQAELESKQGEMQAKQAEAAAKAEIEAKKIASDMEAKRAELEIKSRELALKERELGLKEWEAKEDARQAALDREMELAKVILAKQEAPDPMGEAARLISAPKRVVRDAEGRITGVELA